MQYHAYELAHALLSPWRLGAEALRAGLSHPLNPFALTPAARSLSAACDLFEKVTRRYGKPAFAIHETRRHGRKLPIVEDVLATKPFATLRRFRAVRRPGEALPPSVLLIAPMSGHYTTLLRDTIRTLVPDHDVAVTDWADARDVPLFAGSFDLADFIDHVCEFLRLLAPRTHVIAVSQSSVPALAATALLERRRDAAAPASLTLLGGPIDARIHPTTVNRLVEARPLSWFEDNVITYVPPPHAGAMRRVYPGFMQLTGFMTMDLDWHMSAQTNLFRDLVRGDQDSMRRHREFYEDYLAVMDLSAEFFLDTIRLVFQEHALATGTFQHRGELVDPGAIRRTPLLTVEAERDLICGAGQTHAAHALCRNLVPDLKHRCDLSGVGHFGLFNGARWRSEVAPRIATLIATVERGEFEAFALPDNVVKMPLCR